MAYDLEFLLNASLSREELKDLSRKLSLPVSDKKGDLVGAICLREKSAIGIEKAAFYKLLITFLDSLWDEYRVEIVRLNLNIPDSSTKAEILVKIVDGLVD
jgi:hypothetical protein